MRHHKSLLFFLLCFVISASYGQSSATMYGAIDTGILYQSKTANSNRAAFGTLTSGLWPTFWGITGAEDAGNGTKIIFKLEGGFSSTTGAIGNSNGNLWGRQAYVGIDSRWGTLKAGLQISPFYYSIATADPREMSLFFSGTMSPYVTAFGFNGAFESDAIVYDSPALAGFNFSLQYAFGNVAGNTTAGQHKVAAVNYQNGPFTATASYFSAKDPDTGVSTYQGQNLGIGYTIGPVIVKLAFQKYRNRSTNSPLTNLNVYEVGGDWDIYPDLSASAAVYLTQDRNVNANRSIMCGAGLSYALSKQTLIYTQVGYVNNEGIMNTGLAVDASSSFASAKGGTIAVDVGIRHNF
ncbi:porin [Paraburkholderia graminis]|uniref:porin n=1 Tax=Paraburkholderia graminis TaxID=60548 RepID=UPI0038BA0292